LLAQGSSGSWGGASPSSGAASDTRGTGGAAGAGGGDTADAGAGGGAASGGLMRVIWTTVPLPWTSSDVAVKPRPCSLEGTGRSLEASPQCSRTRRDSRSRPLTSTRSCRPLANAKSLLAFSAPSASLRVTSSAFNGCTSSGAGAGGSASGSGAGCAGASGSGAGGAEAGGSAACGSAGGSGAGGAGAGGSDAGGSAGGSGAGDAGSDAGSSSDSAAWTHAVACSLNLRTGDGHTRSTPWRALVRASPCRRRGSRPSNPGRRACAATSWSPRRG
jgi:hypothetical protein